jgi:hypothetical protein
MPVIDLTGRTFGDWTVIEKAGARKNKMYWKVRCACGTLGTADTHGLQRNDGKGTKRCIACGHKEQAKSLTRHGLSKAPEFAVFASAKNRCTNPNDGRYHDYGGRGIEFRLESIEQMIEHIGFRPTPRHQLDRIENDGHYEIGNIQWSTPKKNAERRRPKKKPSASVTTASLQELSAC